MDRQTLINHLDELFSEIAEERGDEFGLTVLEDALDGLTQWSAATTGASASARMYLHATPLISYAGQRDRLTEAALADAVDHESLGLKTGTVTLRDGYDNPSPVPVAAAARRGIDKQIDTHTSIVLFYDVEDFRQYNHEIAEREEA